MKFSGVIPPVVTPLHPDGSPDCDSLCRLIDDVIGAGVNGIFVLGSSGEAIYLDDEYRRRVAEVAVHHTAGRVPVLVGALDATANRVKQQIHLMDGIAADAYVVTAPFYAKQSPAEIVAHFRAISQASNAPVLAYDIPGNVGHPIEREVIVPLLTEGAIAGLKDSTGELSRFRRIIDDVSGTDCSLLTGSDVLADLALMLGADGLIPGLANVRPDLFVALIRAVQGEDHDTAEKIQRAINHLVDIFLVGTSFGLGRHAAELGAMKALLVHRGVIATVAVSSPLQPLPSQAIDHVIRIFHETDELYPITTMMNTHTK